MGVKQDSIFFYWATGIEADGLTWWEVSAKEPRRGKKIRQLKGNEPVSAFTVAELGEILPKFFYSKKWLKEWGIFGENLPEDYKEPSEIMSEKTEADARGKMLIYLKENNLLELEK